MSRRSREPLEPRREPDTETMAADTLMTSVFTGVGLVIATIILATTGTLMLALGRSLAGSAGARVGLGVGLLVGALAIGWALRRFAARMRARSANLYRGAWIGSVAALVIIVLMAYFPQVVFPQYCPPGQICTGGRR
jgi:uncharacterized membrane protein